MKITTHNSYLRASRLAAQTLQNPRLLSRLLGSAEQKLHASNGGLLATLRETSAAPLRMLQAWRRGEYRTVPWRSLLLLTASITYFVMPVDAVPDVVPLLGFTDDLALLTWVAQQLHSELERFRCWEQQESQARNDLATRTPPLAH